MNWNVNKSYRGLPAGFDLMVLHLRKIQNQPICYSSICIMCKKMLKELSEVHGTRNPCKCIFSVCVYCTCCIGGYIEDFVR